MVKRNRNKNIEDIENEIEQWKEQNRKQVEAFLYPGEKEYLVLSGYRPPTPVLYQIDTIKRSDIDRVPSFLRKTNKRIFKLKKSDLKKLDECGISYKPYSHMIYLY